MRRIQNHYEIDIKIEENKLGIDPDLLFTCATRNNLKRKFLFVSKVLGKHLSVRPRDAVISGKLLAALYMNDDALISSLKEGLFNADFNMEALEKRYPIGEDTGVIAFAETATSLGHLVFDTFENGYAFYHTTRERLEYEGSVISFEEEHSHATSHLVYQDENLPISKCKEIILVDDEISTGNTLLNIILSIKENYAVKRFSVLTIMDLRKEEHLEKFRSIEKEYDITIDVHALLKGQIMSVKPLEVTNETIAASPLFSDAFDTQEDVLANKIYLDGFKQVNDDYLYRTGRFGIDHKDYDHALLQMKKAASKLQSYTTGKTLVLGSEEFMYMPMIVASYIDGDIMYRSTTRSPIYPCKGQGYPIQSGVRIKSLYNPDVNNYAYNLEEENFETVFLCVEASADEDNLKYTAQKLKGLGITVYCVYFVEKPRVSCPVPMGSYEANDVTFLLKDVTGDVKEQSNEEREKAIQSGVHYSEMLPIEYKPTQAYLDIFYHALDQYADKVAKAVAITSQKVIQARGKDLVLVSLARAGTPAGVLMKRYIQKKYDLDVAHYSISIIRGRGIDESAMAYILDRHPTSQIQFLDGWTGKGAITNELREAVEAYDKKYKVGNRLSYELAVLADPGYAVRLWGTREDFLIPNACLNSTISGLMSRTFYNTELIGQTDFHGAKYYQDLESEDLSKWYIEKIEKEFDFEDYVLDYDMFAETPSWQGLQDVKNIEKDFDIDSIHFIKPGIGETTRVLLRRMPWKILISENAKNIEHVLQLAEEKNVIVETYPLKAYNCCGIIKSLKGE